MTNGSTLLSDCFELHKHGRDLEFVDLDLSTDLNLYVDPILLYKSTIKDFNHAHTLIVEFFQRAIEYVKNDKGYKAKEMCQFYDAENMLGVASTKPGHGPSKKLGERIYDELVCNEGIQNDGLAFLNEFQLIIDNISYDLISDAAVQISKQVFINYTQEKCEEYGIPLQELPISNIYDWEENEWDDRYEMLPLNPFTDKPFLLTPWTIVRKYPDCDYKDFYKEVYRYVLMHKERDAQWKAMGKEPKVTFADIKDKYSVCKEDISHYVKEKPEALSEYFEKILPSEETNWLASLSLQQGVNANKLVNYDILDTFQDIISGTTFEPEFTNLRKGIEHQLKLKKPKKRLINEIESLVGYCKGQVVLLLGNFTDGNERLHQLRDIIEQKYVVIRIDEIKQEASNSLMQSVATIASLARFTILEDSYPGGQLYELATLISTGNIIAVLREEGKNASFMSAGVSRQYTNVEEFNYSVNDGQVNTDDVKRAIKWSNDKFFDETKFWKEQYPWQQG